MNLRVTMLLVVFTLAAGCTHFPGQDPRAALERRVSAHWQHKQDKQWGDAYGFFCAEHRSEQDKANYMASSNLDIVGFEIQSIDMAEDGASAVVTTVYDSSIQGYTFRGAKIKETWRYVDHAWCLGQRADFKELFKKK